MDARSRLLARVGDLTDPELPRALVTLEEFFTDNFDETLVGDVRVREFTPQEFFIVLQLLRTRMIFTDVRVEVKLPRTPGGWPSTDTIWIVSSLDRMELPRNLSRDFWDRFMPDDWLTFPRTDGRTTEPLAIPAGSAFGFYYY